MNMHRKISAKEIHNLFMKLPAYKWEEVSSIPFDNGIYIMYDNDEHFDGSRRIVRIGTHGLYKNNNGLKKRLKKHYNSSHKMGKPGGSKSSSILRKKIGEALLKNDPKFQKEWLSDHTEDREKKTHIENEVSEYLQKHLTIKVLKVDDYEDRKNLESKLIATLNKDREFTSSISSEWLGKDTGEKPIICSGLWLSNELKQDPLSYEDWEKLGDIVKESRN